MIFILKLQLLKSILIFMVHQLAIKKVFIRKLDDYVKTEISFHEAFIR